MDRLTNLDFEQDVGVISIETQHFMKADPVLGDDTMLLWAVLPTFRRDLLPSSSG
jgi:hypothetical protein